MFDPHHYIDNGRYGIIMNENESLRCGYSITADGEMLTWNDPFTQIIHLTGIDLHVAKVWVMDQIVRKHYKELKLYKRPARFVRFPAFSLVDWGLTSRGAPCRLALARQAT